MDRMYAVDGQKHAWAGHSCGAVKDNALLFPYASPSGKAEGSADSNSIKKEGLKHGIFHRKSIHNKEEGRNDICFILGGAVAPFPHLLWVFLCVSPGELLVEVAALTWQQQWQVRHLVGCIHAAEESLVETAVTRVSPWKSWCFIQQ